MIARRRGRRILVTAVISLHDDPGEWRRLPAAHAQGTGGRGHHQLALVSALGAHRPAWALALLVVVGVVLFLAYRAYAQQSQGHAQVEHLYAFTRALDGSRDMDDQVAGRPRPVARPAPGRGRRAGRARAGRPAAPDPPARQRPSVADDRARPGARRLRGCGPARHGVPVLRRRPATTDRSTAWPSRSRSASGTGALLVTGSLPDVGPFTDAAAAAVPGAGQPRRRRRWPRPAWSTGCAARSPRRSTSPCTTR